MEKKDFILILVIIIALSGGYYLYSNQLWPFSDSSRLPKSVSQQVFAVSGVVKEVYDTVVIFELNSPQPKNLPGELTAVVNGSTSIFRYAIDGNIINRLDLTTGDLRIGDRIALTSDEDIASIDSGVFLASSIAVYK